MRKRNFAKIWKNRDRASEAYRCFRVTNQWMRLTLAYLGLKELEYPFTLTTRNKKKVKLHTRHDLITAWVIFCREEYKIPPGTKTVIDAGANIGVFSIYASSKGVKKIYALEPFPSTLEQLKENINLNNLQSLISIFPVALADKSGERRMDLSEGPSQSRGLINDGDDRQGVKVAILTLSDFFEKIDTKQVDFFKMDIEGGEYDVLLTTDDGTLKQIKNFALEYHPSGSKRDLFNRLTNSQFRLEHDFEISPESGVAHFQRG